MLFIHEIRFEKKPVVHMVQCVTISTCISLWAIKKLLLLHAVIDFCTSQSLLIIINDYHHNHMFYIYHLEA